MKQNSFPPGWDEERVRRVLAHYEEQTEVEAVAEDEAALEDQTQTVMEIPTELVPAVRELIARHRTPSSSSAPTGVPASTSRWKCASSSGAIA